MPSEHPKSFRRICGTSDGCTEKLPSKDKSGKEKSQKSLILMNLSQSKVLKKSHRKSVYQRKSKIH